MSSVYQHKTPLHSVRTAARSLPQQGRSDPPIKSRSFRRAATTSGYRARTGPINICIYSATRRKSRHSRGLAADRGTRTARHGAALRKRGGATGKNSNWFDTSDRILSGRPQLNGSTLCFSPAPEVFTTAFRSKKPTVWFIKWSCTRELPVFLTFCELLSFEYFLVIKKNCCFILRVSRRL